MFSDVQRRRFSDVVRGTPMRSKVCCIERKRTGRQEADPSDVVAGARLSRWALFGLLFWCLHSGLGGIVAPLGASSPVSEQVVGMDANAYLGTSVATDEWIVLGAPNSECNEIEGAGAVYVSDAQGTVDVICADDSRSGAQFGQAVSVDGDSIAVGAPYHGPGAVYVFDRIDGLWVERRKHTPPTAAGPTALYGWAVQLSGEKLFVGTPTDRSLIEAGGAVYIYESDSLVKTLRHGNFHDRFGYSIAWNGTRLVVGVPGDDRTFETSTCACACPELKDCQGTGSVFLFAPECGWCRVGVARSNAPYCRESFGHSVAWSGDNVVIGAPARADHCSPPGGSIYIRDTSIDLVIGPIQASDSHPGDFFGTSVSSSDAQIAVGAPGAAGMGATYLIDSVNLTETARLEAADAQPGDEYGAAVAIDGETIVVGAPLDETQDSPENAGTATTEPLS